MHRVPSLAFLVVATAIALGVVAVDESARRRAETARLTSALISRMESPCYQFLLEGPATWPIPCSNKRALDAAPTVEVSGLFTVAFEVAVLEPCDSSETWWIWSDPCSDGEAKIRRLIGHYVNYRDSSRTVYVRLRGQLSSPDSCGHLGMYKRLFRIESVLDARLPTTRDCRAPKPGASNPGMQRTRYARR